MEANQEMRLTIHFAINVFSVPQIFFIPQPKHPPDGWITDIVMKSFVAMIFGVLMFKYLCRLYAILGLRFVRKTVRCTLNANWFVFLLKIGKIAAPSRFTCPFNIPVGISLYLSQFSIAKNIALQDLLIFFTKQDQFETADHFHDAKSGFESELFFFDAMDGYSDAGPFEATRLCDESRVRMAPVLPVSHALVSALATSGEEDTGGTSVATFDSASSFWVCDNSATGHICKSKSMFHGPLVPSVWTVSTATGYSEELLMGTVVLTLRCDEGIEHTFLLKDVVFMENSPVNILSTRRLSELFPDADGNIDKQGTGVSSFFDKHELIWNHKKHKCTFNTAISGLPECLFNTGYSNFVSYATKLSKHYDDSLSWAFTSETNVIEVSEGDLLDISVEKTIAFLEGMKLILNNGNGIKSVVKFIGVEFPGGTRQKCRVLNSDGTTDLVDPEMLHFLENPDIASIPQTSDDYCKECEVVSKEDLKGILEPQSLSPLQEEMMSYHLKLHHLPFPKLVELAERGEIPKRLATLKGRTPVCVACIFGTAHKKPWRTKSKKYNPIRRPEDDAPGKRISTDQLVSAQPGLIPQMSGFLTNQRIVGATVFVDHFSNHVFVYLMKDLTLAETLLAKDAYERFLNSVGVSAKAYHADNGRYADKGFVDNCRSQCQTITFCGVGGHHQNGIAERYIKSLTLGGRTLLLHAKRMLPEYISTMLWPFAIKCFEDRMNHLTCNKDGKTPYHLLAGLDTTELDVKSFHTFGCPCYVLDNRLQSGLTILPKWEPRARMGIYVGRSPAHASNVALILNPRTGHVSPQFHVVYDDDFTTVPYLRTGKVPPHWEKLIQQSAQFDRVDNQMDTWQSLKGDNVDDGDFTGDRNDTQPVIQQSNLNDPLNDTDDEVIANAAALSEEFVRSGYNFETTATQPGNESSDSVSVTQSQNSTSGSDNHADREGEESLPKKKVSFADEQSYAMPPAVDLNTSGLRRSRRIQELNKSQSPEPASRMAYVTKLKEKSKLGLALFGMFCTIAVHTSSTLSTTMRAPMKSTRDATSSMLSKTVESFHKVNTLYDGTLNCFSTAAMAAVSSNEVFTFKQAMNEDDGMEFVKAMVKEIKSHEDNEHWTMIERSKMPLGTKTIMSIWTFKRKRFPSGILNKHKARICAHGGMQTWGQNYWETYAPVVNWASVRLLLSIAKIHNLPSKGIDFVLAFPQADLEVPVYMEMPMGFVSADDKQRGKYVLRLNKSLYGLKQASYNWFEKLRSGLCDRGFVQSQVDPCVFFGDGCIVLTYVDDVIIIGDTTSKIDDLILSLHEGDEKFVFTDEGSIDKYLGVDIKKIDDTSFEMTQPFLIERITSLLGIDNGRTHDKHTPVGKPLLNKDLNGVDRKYTWKYRSAIGMLTYLTGSVRPEIQMAVHQCARFNNNPKRSHEQAVMRIGRYLLGSKDRGIVFSPDSTKGLEVFVDADFAGMWDPENATDADTVYSRTGFTIRYAGCPVFWQSKLQTEIALSTAEAEYIAMSQALRETIPLHSLMKEINGVFELYIPEPKFVLKVHEDNQSCIAMGKNPKFTPRTKHIAIKYHHFRKHVKTSSNKDGFIQIVYCPTHDQLADIFTKPTTDEIFFKLRKELMGW